MLNLLRGKTVTLKFMPDADGLMWAEKATLVTADRAGVTVQMLEENSFTGLTFYPYHTVYSIQAEV